MTKLSIGKMAKLNQVTVQTLRYYEKIGLLAPDLVDSETGYRYYHINQCARLDMIQYMKCLGMSLESIKHHFDQRDIQEFSVMLEEHEAWINTKIEELTTMKAAAKQYQENIGRYVNAPENGVIQLEHMNERRIFSYDAGVNFYESGMDTWEYMIRGLKNQITIAHLPMVKFCNVGSILRKSHLAERKYYSTEIFIFVNEPNETTEVLPGGVYLTVHCDDFYREQEFGNRLLDYAQEHDYEIIGDYICEVVTELPIFEDERRLFIKLQIPVKHA
ncbi:helix-turn-helix domain-containing protein [Gottschalkiaceae bacterium SANA]|nr:helix-turn-helix domain-containing protein [Gottschalkiaceae bacterium SANA]